jgi:hypothetical protein
MAMLIEKEGTRAEDSTYIAAPVSQPDGKLDDGVFSGSLALSPSDSSGINLDHVLQRDLVMVRVLNLGGQTNNLLKWKMYCRNRGIPWPPCDNYYAAEPYNHIRLGSYASGGDGHHCSSCDQHSGKYSVLNDNKIENIIVLCFRGSTDRTGVNRHMLLHCLLTQLLTSPEVFIPGTRYRASKSMLKALMTDNEPFDVLYCNQLLPLNI